MDFYALPAEGLLIVVQCWTSFLCMRACDWRVFFICFVFLLTSSFSTFRYANGAKRIFLHNVFWLCLDAGNVLFSQVLSTYTYIRYKLSSEWVNTLVCLLQSDLYAFSVCVIVKWKRKYIFLLFNSRVDRSLNFVH